MGRIVPIGDLTAEIERQAADAVVRIRIRENEMHFNHGVDLNYARSAALIPASLPPMMTRRMSRKNPFSGATLIDLFELIVIQLPPGMGRQRDNRRRRKSRPVRPHWELVDVILNRPAKCLGCY